MLESEEERIDAAQKVNERTNHNIPIVQRGFAKAIVDHEVHNKQRNKECQQIASTLSA